MASADSEQSGVCFGLSIVHFRKISLAWLLCALSGCSLLFESAGVNADLDADPDVRPADASSDAFYDAAPISCDDESLSTLPVSCLQDHFTSPRADLWDVYRNSDQDGVDVMDDELLLGMSEFGNDRALIVSKNTYDLNDSEVVLEVVRVPDPNYGNVWSVLTLFSPSLDASRAVKMGCNLGKLKTFVIRGGAEQELQSALCDTETDRFWKISQAGSTVSFWRSIDGDQWVLVESTPDTDLMLDQVVVSIVLENYNPDGFSGVDNNFVVEAINP